MIFEKLDAGNWALGFGVCELPIEGGPRGERGIVLFLGWWLLVLAHWPE